MSDEQGYGFVTGVTYEMNYDIPASLDLTWIKSAHQFKFGAARLQTGQVFKDSQYPNGGFTFTRLETALPDFTGVQAGRPLGSGYASYLLGQVDSAVVQSPVAQRYAGVAWGFYAQDQWRATPKLTLDYGLRWDMFFPPYEEHDRNGTFDPTSPNPGVGGHLGH
jgi:outer membrane receptor protein involved in Fe transport